MAVCFSRARTVFEIPVVPVVSVIKLSSTDKRRVFCDGFMKRGILERNHIRVQLRQSVAAVAIDRHHAQDFIDIARIHQLICRHDRNLRLRRLGSANHLFEKIANAGLKDASTRRSPAVFGPLEPSVGSEEDQTVLPHNLRRKVAGVDFETVLAFEPEGISVVGENVGLIYGRDGRWW